MIHPADTTIEWIRAEFNIPQHVRAQCDDTFLRVWNPQSLRDKMKDGVLHMYGEDWIIHWQSTPAVCFSAENVAFSFRKYKGRNYVVAKVWERAHNRPQQEVNTTNEG